MARLRELRQRLRAVADTRKIIRTMELVAAARARRTQDQLRAAVSFGQGVRAACAAALPEFGSSPLSAPGRPGGAKGLWAITSDRGFCGGFNVSVVRRVSEEAARRAAAGEKVRLWVLGRRGRRGLAAAGLEFQTLELAAPGRPDFAELLPLARRWLGEFLAGSLSGLTLVASAPDHGVPAARAKTILPLALPPPPAQVPELLIPGRAALAQELSLLALTCALREALLESALAEHLARRVAMHRAADNADQMLRDLRRSYQRLRQSGITREIAEILGGGEAA